MLNWVISWHVHMNSIVLFTLFAGLCQWILRNQKQKTRPITKTCNSKIPQQYPNFLKTSILPFPKRGKFAILLVCPFFDTLTVSVFDLIILVILAALTLRGIWKGMVSQIVSAVSLVICWIVATRFGSLVAPTIPLEAPWNQVAAMAIVFFATWIGIRFARAALEKLIKDWHLQKLNTLLGGILGFTKGLLFCLIITFFAVMLSETSRAVVFNSTSGSHLVHLITRIGLFVPKDSYEFVHTQFAQFQSKVDETIPGQTPEAWQVQSSESMQRLLAQLQQKTGKTESNTNSLWNALSKWWNGSKDEDSDMETLSPVSQIAQNGERSPSPAVTYSQPLPSMLATDNAFTNTSQPAAAKSAVAVAEYFATRQPLPSASPTVQPLTMSAPEPEMINPSSTLAPLTTLAPLSALPELTELLPTLPTQHPIGSDLLLHNSGRTTNLNTSAKVFQSQ